MNRHDDSMARRIAHAFRHLVFAAAIAASLLGATPAAAQGTVPAVVPAEVEGRINGQAARFVADGDNVLVSVAEAERLGVAYLGGRRLTIGGTPLWLVTLGSVTVDKKTRLMASAGVVPSIPAYFAALRANAVEAMARSREVEVEVAGHPARVFDFGVGGFLMAAAEARRIGLDYEKGERTTVGEATAWRVEAPIRRGALEAGSVLVVISDPEVYFKALQAELARKR